MRPWLAYAMINHQILLLWNSSWILSEDLNRLSLALMDLSFQSRDTSVQKKTHALVVTRKTKKSKEEEHGDDDKKEFPSHFRAHLTQRIEAEFRVVIVKALQTFENGNFSILIRIQCTFTLNAHQKRITMSFMWMFLNPLPPIVAFFGYIPAHHRL